MQKSTTRDVWHEMEHVPFCLLNAGRLSKKDLLMYVCEF